MQLKDFTEAEKNETTTEEVERVFDIPKATYAAEDGNPLCYFEFVLNPHSFGRTVENIFYVSFLVRDGLARIFLDSDDLPVIEPRVEPVPGKQTPQDQKRHQAVISLTPKDWKELLEIFKIQYKRERTRHRMVTRETCVAETRKVAPLSGADDIAQFQTLNFFQTEVFKCVGYCTDINKLLLGL